MDLGDARDRAGGRTGSLVRRRVVPTGSAREAPALEPKKVDHGQMLVCAGLPTRRGRAWQMRATFSGEHVQPADHSMSGTALIASSMQAHGCRDITHMSQCWAQRRRCAHLVLRRQVAGSSARSVPMEMDLPTESSIKLVSAALVCADARHSAAEGSRARGRQGQGEAHIVEFV